VRSTQHSCQLYATGARSTDLMGLFGQTSIPTSKKKQSMPFQENKPAGICYSFKSLRRIGHAATSTTQRQKLTRLCVEHCRTRVGWSTDRLRVPGNVIPWGRWLASWPIPLHPESRM
jgi:hypothetical protein